MPSQPAVFGSIIRNSTQLEIPRSIVQEVIRELVRLTCTSSSSQPLTVTYHIELISTVTGLLSRQLSRSIMPYALRMFTRSLHSKEAEVILLVMAQLLTMKD